MLHFSVPALLGRVLKGHYDLPNSSAVPDVADLMDPTAVLVIAHVPFLPPCLGDGLVENDRQRRRV